MNTTESSNNNKNNNNKPTALLVYLAKNNPFYFMLGNVFLRTKTVVEFIKHDIHDPSGAFLTSGISLNDVMFRILEKGTLCSNEFTKHENQKII